MKGPLGPLVWAQYRSFVNRLPQLWRGGGWAMAVVGVVFYGVVTVLAVAAGLFCAHPSSPAGLEEALARGLLLATLYWQVIPLALSAQGVSLDLKRLRAFPIPRRSLFRLELALRCSASPEPILVLLGAAAGLALNPDLDWRAPVAILLLIGWNLLVLLLARELLSRFWRRTWAQFTLMLVFVAAAALPRILATFQPSPRMIDAVRLLAGIPWPWKITAQIASGHSSLAGWCWLLLWCAAALWLAHGEFYRGLDREESTAQRAGGGGQGGLFDALAELAARGLRDPLAALLEKEIRSLVRSPRFLLAFLMGFTFSIVIFVPPGVLRGNAGDSFLSRNYLSIVAIYSVLLLGQVLFWNCLGFDRAGAAIYFVSPARIGAAIQAKNLAAALFLLLEISLVALVCASLRLPLTLLACAECYGATIVLILYLLAAGNLVSVSRPWPQDPGATFRSSTGVKMQPLLLLVAPIVFVPVGLAYLARYAFASEAAFFLVLGAGAVIGVVFYRIAIESAVATACRRRETITAMLSETSGVVS
jgi:ABC-2 type transport system permease protein